MKTFMDIIGWIGGHWQELIGGVVALMGSLVAIFMLIPGDQPEKTLQKIVDFLAKFSKKP